MSAGFFIASLLASTAPLAVAPQTNDGDPQQPVPAAPAEPQQEAPSAPAAAQAGPASGDIIVTAQRRSERLQDVPIAITAIGAEGLVSAGAKNLTELQGVAPGIFVSTNSGYGASPISIRGTAGTNSTLLDDPVAVYINDVYQASGSFGGTGLLDVASVEIVRGPQGTLQGRNATAGAVLVRTALPTSTFQGFTRFSVADPFEVRGETAVGGPISDTLGVRIAGNFYHERGWATNTFDGSHTSGGHGYAVRGTLQWRPTPDLDLRLVGERNVSYSEAALIRWATTPFNPSATGPLVLPGTATPTTPLTASQYRAVLRDNQVALNRPNFSNIAGNSVSLNGTYSFGGVDLVSVTGYANIKSNGGTDSDGLARTDREGFNTGSLPTENFSQELRLQSSGQRRLSWIVGAYYSNSQQDMDFSINNLQLTVADRRTTRFVAFQTTNSYAAFADATFNITPEVAAIGGIRYTRETKDFQFDRTAVNYDTRLPLAAVFQYRPAQAEFNNTSYRAKLTYQPTTDMLFYASYSRGFKGGGFNAFGTDPAFRPEILRSAELGMKLDLWARRANLAVAVYSNNYDDLQVRVGVPTGGVAITNAADSKIKGFEIEGTLRATPTFTLTGNVAYTNARFSSFPLARNLLDQGPFDASGNFLPRTPQWQFYTQASWTPALSADLNALLEGSVRYRSRIYMYQTDQTAYTVQGAPLTEAGLRAGVRLVPEQLSITAFATNLNNGRSVSGTAINFSYPVITLNRPRTVGLQIEKRF